MKYYLAGYYLMKLRPIKWGKDIDKLVYTASSCINDALLNYWSFSWTTNNNTKIEDIKKLFNIDNNTIEKIRKWVDEAFNKNKIGWGNIFYDLETLKEYLDFFPIQKNLIILALYFSEQNVIEIIEEFKPESENIGRIGLELFLSEKRQDIIDVEETDIGFDLIGIENGGYFHSFYCHNVTDKLLRDFKFLRINQYGLFKKLNQRQINQLEEYAIQDNTGFEPVSWFFPKVKLIEI